MLEMLVKENVYMRNAHIHYETLHTWLTLSSSGKPSFIADTVVMAIFHTPDGPMRQ